MSALLPSERGTWKGRLFLGCVYALLTLGGITMNGRTIVSPPSVSNA